MAVAWLTICFAISVVMPMSARTAQRWDTRRPVTVWTDPAHAPPEGAQLVERAVNAWNAAADGRVVLQRVDTPTTAAIRVRFAASDVSFGETEPRVDPGTGAIMSADITLSNDVTGDPLTQHIAVYLTALHEIGHALGLPHGDSEQSIMYRFRRQEDSDRFFDRYRRTLRRASDIGRPPATGLSEADVQAIRALYDR